MSPQNSRFSNAVAVLLATAAGLVAPAAAPQACCAGSSAATPARLGQHEIALVGTEWHATTLFGSFDQRATFAPSPGGTSEYDFEEDVFGAVRVLARGQVALLVPIDETWRATPMLRDFGGGIGDINLGARYDFVLAGESRYVPGVAALAGVSFPTGTPVEAAKNPLATDSTGIGAFQYNVGLSVEQVLGPWLAGGSLIAAARSPRTADGIHEQLAPQFTGLLYGAYTFDAGSSLALIASYQAEGDAVVEGQTALQSARGVAAVNVAGLLPFNTWLKGVLTLSTDLPFGGQNAPALAGLLATVVATWR